MRNLLDFSGIMGGNVRCLQLQNKPTVFSKLLRFVLLVAIASVLAFGLILVGIPKWIVFILIIFLYLAFTVYWPAHIIYKSKSINAIHRYVRRNYNQPIFSYSYALGNGNDEDIEVALKRVMKTYDQEDMHDVYGANLAIHHNNPDEVLEHAKNIEGLDYQHYYHAYAYVLQGRLDEAAAHLEKLETPWMVHSIKAVVAKRRGDKEVFGNEATKSIESALGMQRYVLHHTMRRLAQDI